jgi:hypothetical protein
MALLLLLLRLLARIARGDKGGQRLLESCINSSLVAEEESGGSCIIARAGTLGRRWRRVAKERAHGDGGVGGKLCYMNTLRTLIE